jgi:hypothetical protein
MPIRVQVPTENRALESPAKFLDEGGELSIAWSLRYSANFGAIDITLARLAEAQASEKLFARAWKRLLA